MRGEVVATTLAYGAGSLFWLVGACRMDAASYGRLMQVQAVLLLGVGLFSCRTFDLLFHLQKTHGWDLRSSFRCCLRLEAGLFGGCLLLGAVVGGTLPASRHLALPSAPLLVGAVALCGLAIFQGSTQGLLRARQLDYLIVRSDLAAGLGFAVATAAGLLMREPPILGLWLAAQAIRPLALLAAVALHPTPAGGGPSPLAPALIAKYLAAGQLTNLLKNNVVAIETLLLGRIAGPESVAVYRVARAFLNLPTVVTNVVYQKAYRALVETAGQEARAVVVRRINRQSFVLWLAAVPAVMTAAAVFPWLTPDPAYGELLLLSGLLLVALLPLAFQQAEFALLAMAGRFARINAAYIVGLSVLVAGGFLFRGSFSWPVFSATLLVGGLARVVILRGATVRLPS